MRMTINKNFFTNKIELKYLEKLFFEIPSKSDPYRNLIS